MVPATLDLRLWIVLAAASRVVAALVLGDRFHFIDEAIYVDAARALLAGDGFGPGYANVPAQPVWLAALAAPWPAHVVAIRAAHAVVTGALGAVAVHALARRIGGVVAARLALALWALDPLVVVAGGLLYPESTAAVVLAAALAAALDARARAAERRAPPPGAEARAVEDPAPSAASGGLPRDRRVLRHGRAAAVGALLGFLVLFRPVAAVLVPVVALWSAAVPNVPLAWRARRALAVAGAAALMVAPWVLANLAHGGRVIPAGMAGVQAAPVPAVEVQRDGLATSLARSLWHEPGRMSARIGRELVRFWELYPTRLQTDDAAKRAALRGSDARLPTDATLPPGLRDVASAVSFGAEAAAALVGIAVAWRRRRAAVVLLVAVAFAYGLGYALFVAKLRYRIAVLPALFALAGVGVERLVRRAGVGRVRVAAAEASADAMPAELP